MLGFRNFAEVSLAPKMAESPQQVIAFLEDLATRARPHADKDWDELRTFAAKELGLAELAPWDVAFAAEKLRQQRYAFSENEVKQYFPEPAALRACSPSPRRCSACRSSRTTRRCGTRTCVSSASRIATARSSRSSISTCTRAKASAAAHGWTTRSRAKRGSSVQTPVAYLTCNFGAGRRQARLLHARRSHHAVP